MDRIEWTNAVVGKPWRDRTSGPDTFDCWGLVVDSFRRVDDTEIPVVTGYDLGAPIEVAGEAEKVSGHWQQVDKAQDGAVFCAYSATGTLAHVGRVFDLRGAGLHAVHARGTNDKGQVAVDAVRVLERFYGGRITYHMLAV
jgi:hypothetical protein